MIRDDIVRWAHKAGLIPPGWGATENQWRSLERFADLAAAAEREDCALICDHESDNAIGLGMAVAAGNCADKIRARGHE